MKSFFSVRKIVLYVGMLAALLCGACGSEESSVCSDPEVPGLVIIERRNTLWKSLFMTRLRLP